MYKQIFLVILVNLLLAFPALSQSSMSFTVRGGIVKSDGSVVTAYALPLTMNFTGDFTGQQIGIYDSAERNPLSLNGAAFGSTIKENLLNVYTLTIDANRNIHEVPNAPAINLNVFSVKIGSKFFGPFHLSSGPPPPDPTGDRNKQVRYNPGYLFDDAWTIYSQLFNITTLDPENLQGILNYYGIHNSNYKENPFLVNIKPLDSLFKVHLIEGVGLTPAGIGGAIGGLDVTKVGDGLAQFLVERFKEELSEAFFNKFKKDLESPQFADLKILFPNTFSTLETIGDNIYQYTIFLKTLRQVFIKDLTNGYTNFNTLLSQAKYRQYFANQHPEIGSVLYTALYYINGLKAGKHPGDILDQFTGVLNAGQPASYFAVCQPGHCTVGDSILGADLTGAVKTLQLFSWSLRSRTGKAYWVSSDSLALLFSDVDGMGLRIFLGLIWQKLNKPTFTKPYSDINYGYDSAGSYRSVNLASLLKMAASNLDSLNLYKGFITGLINKAETVDQNLQDFKGKKKSDLDYNDYYQLYSSAIAVLQQAASFVDLPYLPLKDAFRDRFTQAANRTFYLAQSAGELYIDINTANYSSAIQSVVGILDTVWVNNDGVAAGYAGVRNTLLRYGSFIAAVAEAKTSEDVKNAIESIALPAGSFSIKQKSRLNLSLNGYVGYAFDMGSYFSSGIYAPVGLSLNWGLGKKKKGGAFSLFASVFDIGAIVSYRLRDDTTSNLKQTIRLESILSPSLQLLYEFPGLPLTLCIGGRQTPKLFYSSSTDFQVVKPRIAINASILIDIPIITIFNKTN